MSETDPFAAGEPVTSGEKSKDDDVTGATSAPVVVEDVDVDEDVEKAIEDPSE